MCDTENEEDKKEARVEIFWVKFSFLKSSSENSKKGRQSKINEFKCVTY